MPHAPETATTSASECGTGYPANVCWRRGTTTKIAATAAKESWNPASSSEYGLHASRSAAPRSRKYQRSLGLDASQASEARTPATPARTTDGCQPIGEACEATATPDDSPLVSAHHDVHSVPTKPRALVEAVLRAAREPDLADQIEDRSLRRGAAGRKTEQHGLADVLIAKAPHLRGHPHVERRATRGAGHGDERALRSPDARQQCAPVEPVEPHAAPPPPAEGERDSERGNPPPSRQRDGCGDDDNRRQHHGEPRSAPQVGSGQADAETRDEQLRPRAQQATHGAAASRSCSMRAGPIPGIASNSSSELKAPCF